MCLSVLQLFYLNLILWQNILPKKMYKTLFYFFIMLIIALSPTICLFKNGVVISKNEYYLMEEAIRNSNGSLISQNGKIINDNFYISDKSL